MGQAREGQADDQGAARGCMGRWGGPGAGGGTEGIYQGAWPGRISQVRVSGMEQAGGTPRQVQNLGSSGGGGKGGTPAPILEPLHLGSHMQDAAGPQGWER